MFWYFFYSPLIVYCVLLVQFAVNREYSLHSL